MRISLLLVRRVFSDLFSADIAEWSEGVITHGEKERINGKHSNCVKRVQRRCTLKQKRIKMNPVKENKDVHCVVKHGYERNF